MKIPCRKAIAAAVLTLLAAPALWSCAPKPVGPVGPEGKRLTWAAMNADQRRAHMQNEILPIAADIFGAWRPERFAAVDCRLCHGSGAAADNFKMPTAHLPRLSGELLLGPEFAQHRETTQLKLNRLVPQMAEALGKSPFSLITRRGFGCYSCHLGPTGPRFGN